MRTASLLLAACLAGTAVQGSANEFNGTIKGSIDGHPIDVKAVCSPDKQPWDILQVVSDPAHQVMSLGDVDGDRIAIVAGAGRSMRTISITMKVGETLYKFSSRRPARFDDDAFAIAGKFTRTEGKGKDRKVVSSYQADLTVECRGI
ncbi:MAG: hypothetical protein M9951_07860 [Burkholderiaceae bacterium]|jgi:hypothetical protein|nr:hypothetical protein [Burkholderiaceae bacterium]